MTVFLLVFLYFLFALSGVRAAAVPDGAPIDLLMMIVMAMTATAWVTMDARKAGKPIIRSFHWVIFLTWPLAVPIFVIRSRRWVGLLLVLLHGAMLLLVYAASFFFVAVLAARA